MKCRAMRVGGIETNSDVDDIMLLIRAIGLNNSEDAMTLVEKFYPQNMLQLKPGWASRRYFQTWVSIKAIIR